MHFNWGVANFIMLVCQVCMEGIVSTTCIRSSRVSVSMEIIIMIGSLVYRYPLEDELLLFRGVH